MKRLFILGFSAALVAGGVSSCKKTSKGKMSNEWTVSSMKSESTGTDSDGDKTVTTISLEGTSGTKETVFTISGTSTTTKKSAVVTEMSYTIEKDGTWKSVNDVTWTTTFTGGSSSDATKTTTSGTWSFLSKNKSGDFKKNERVIFNTLAEESATVSSTTVGGSTNSSNSSDKETYAEGENIMTYLVVESKGKELQLKSDSNGTSSATSGGTTSTSSNVGTQTMTLVQK
jgi:hypothetical protein